MNPEEQGDKFSQLLAKCWADEGFKQKLLADPAATLKAEGAELPAGLSIKALENTDRVFHLVIPAKPTELSDEQLDTVAAGAGTLLNYQPPVGQVHPTTTPAGGGGINCFSLCCASL